MDFEATYQKLFNRDIKEQEILELRRIQEILQIGDNDALWVVIIALQYHKQAYAEIPNKISEILNRIPENLANYTQNDTVQTRHKPVDTVIPKNRFFLGYIPAALSYLFICVFVGLFGFTTGILFERFQIDLKMILQLPAGLSLGLVTLTVSLFFLANFIHAFSKNLTRGIYKSLAIGITLLLVTTLILILSFTA